MLCPCLEDLGVVHVRHFPPHTRQSGTLAREMFISLSPPPPPTPLDQAQVNTPACKHMRVPVFFSPPICVPYRTRVIIFALQKRSCLRCGLGRGLVGRACTGTQVCGTGTHVCGMSADSQHRLSSLCRDVCLSHTLFAFLTLPHTHTALAALTRTERSASGGGIGQLIGTFVAECQNNVSSWWGS
jgi:hypothetical protein